MPPSENDQHHPLPCPPSSTAAAEAPTQQPWPRRSASAPNPPTRPPNPTTRHCRRLLSVLRLAPLAKQITIQRRTSDAAEGRWPSLPPTARGGPSSSRSRSSSSSPPSSSLSSSSSTPHLDRSPSSPPVSPPQPLPSHLLFFPDSKTTPLREAHLTRHQMARAPPKKRRALVLVHCNQSSQKPMSTVAHL